MKKLFEGQRLSFSLMFYRDNLVKKDVKCTICVLTVNLDLDGACLVIILLISAYFYTLSKKMQLEKYGVKVWQKQGVRLWQIKKNHGKMKMN